MSKNDTGKQVQRYCLDLEKVFKRYMIIEYQEQQLQLTQANEEKFKIMHKYNSRLQKHRYYKFKKTGPCFYIIIQGLEYKDGIPRIKIGICGCPKRKLTNCPHCDGQLGNNKQNESFDGRLQNHRTLWPQLQVKFAVYTDDAALLEKCLKRVYKAQINPGGHEIIENVDLKDVINKTKKYLKLFNLHNEEKEYLIEENIENYNKVTLTAMKKKIVKEQVTKVVNDVIDDVKEEIKEKNNEILKYQEYMKKIDTYKVNELSQILKDLGLIQKGLKKDKQKRLKSYLENQISKYDKDICKHSNKETLSNLSKYTYEELKKIATKYNLRQIGTCTDLCERIKAYLEQGTIDSKRRKDVFQYDSSGNLVKRWRTITELSEGLKMCKNFIAKNLNSKCLINGFIWMSQPTEFTISDLKQINMTKDTKTRRNLTRADHMVIKEKYKKAVDGGGVPIDVKIALMAEYAVSKTQILRILRK